MGLTKEKSSSRICLASVSVSRQDNMMKSRSFSAKYDRKEQPSGVRKLWWDILKSLRHWIAPSVLVGILLSILRFTPQEWAVRLGAWALFIKQWALLFIFVIFALIVILFLLRLSREYNKMLSGAYPRVGADKSGRFSHRFTSLFDTRSRIMEILQEFSETEVLKQIKIIAGTGGSIVPLFTEYLESGRPIGNTVFRVLIMNPSWPQTKKAAEHWPREAQHNLEQAFPALNERLKKMGKKVQFEWKTYEFFPCVQGLMFGEKYLFIGWMEWIQFGGKVELRGAEKPFSYFERGDENAGYFFTLFESWFDYAWSV